MLKLLNPPTTTGLELTADGIKGAEVSTKKGIFFVQHLSNQSFPIENIAHVKRLYTPSSILCTGIEGYDVLVRSCYLPLTKEKDIDAALTFQAEPLLPYSVEQAFLARQTLQGDNEGTNITFFAVRKDLVEKHLEQWRPFKIEPENVSCIQVALCRFGKYALSTEKPFLIFHFTEKFITGVLVKDGKLLASYTHAEGLNLFTQGQKPLLESDQESPTEIASFPIEALNRIQQILIKIHYALSKEVKGETLEGVLLTGDIMTKPQAAQLITQQLGLPLLQCQESADRLSSEKKQEYAVPIGLAIDAQVSKEAINFRQQEFSYPYPWRRVKGPLVCYFILLSFLAATLYIFGHHYLLYKEDQLRQDYVDLLATMSKSYENFEGAFLAKNALAREKTNGEIVDIKHLNREDLLERLAFLQKDLHSTPDSFPLFANIPRVSDVLAWLSQHPYVVERDENGQLQQRLQLENFSYTMLKRPVQGKKQEKYQVKVELEFSSPTPKWAREFHDALIASNDLVDPKGEVKWSSNRGKYRTSFFLKDKTSYPSQ